MFTQSYLKGMALEWFEPDLLGAGDPHNCPIWMTDWEEFIIELQTTFGPHDPVADAEHQLNHLRMKENHHANRYCYDHVQLRALSGYSGRIAALQLNSSRASLTPVTVAQIYLH